MKIKRLKNRATTAVAQSLITKFGGVLKSMLASDIAIIDIKEYQIKHF